ncbi:MAG: hypothetical protein OEL56_02370 [Nitrosopumilus sp.]|nr:hypothetical protein [Nitrosopumilus sp.]MDH3516271.1 hypothetical protein [Nitrosopumilus sp.]MDH5417829.1 hypothetical protein [Nitrosopumilus sp.]MDH5553868.1 hypothetical protein [Nitrosopumilus sp.]
MEFLQLRIVLILVMFGIASIFDYKSRKVPDVIWIVGVSIGGVMYLFDYQEFSAYHGVTIVTSCFFGFVLYRLQFVGMADLFGIISVSVILPVHYEFVMVPIIATLLALVLAVSVVTIYSVTLNVADLISKRKLFGDFVKEPLYRKVFAFFCIHRKRSYEKFVISSEKYYSVLPNQKSFVILSRNKEISQAGGFVQNTPPFVVFMMIGIVLLLLLPEILNTIFS